MKKPKKLGRPPNKEKIEQKKKEILSMSAKFFSQYGYPNTNVDSIADELEIGKGTIYRYFPSKQELFLATVDRGMCSLQEQIDASIAGVDEPLEQISRAIHTYLAFFDNNPEFVELFIQERAEFRDRKQPTYFSYRDANLCRWRKLFRRLIEEKKIRDIPIERILEVISVLLYGTIFTNYFVGRKKAFEVQAQDILDVLFHGILAR